MPIEGFDFSFARPGGRSIVAAGRAFVVRYVPYPGDGGKGLTAAEIVDYRKNGLAICLVFESTKARARAGQYAGRADATVAQDAIYRLGMPASLPVYFAVDWDAQIVDQPLIDQYLRGAADILGASRVGVYGGINVINRCKVNKSARWFWQTYAWSAGRTAYGIHLYQYSNGRQLNGKAVDYTRAMQAQYGQWQPGVPQEEDVKVTITEFARTKKGVYLAGVRRFRSVDPYDEFSPLGTSGTAQLDAQVVIEQTGVPHGTFLRVAGTVPTYLVPAASVTNLAEVPDPNAALVGVLQKRLDAVKAALVS
jgi:hypothetical protein